MNSRFLVAMTIVMLSGCATFTKITNHLPWLGPDESVSIEAESDYIPLFEPATIPVRVVPWVVVPTFPQATPSPSPWMMFQKPPVSPVVKPKPAPTIAPTPLPSPIPIASPTPVEVTSPAWEPYKRILDASVTLASKAQPAYRPSTTDRCDTLLNRLLVKAISLRYDVLYWPKMSMRAMVATNSPPDIEIWGLTAPGSRRIILNTELTNCGRAETLAHELGHVKLFRYHLSDGLEEIGADLIQYGTIRILDPTHDTANLTIRFLASLEPAYLEASSTERERFRLAVLAVVSELAPK